MFSLASFGFVTTGIFFAIYAFTFLSLVSNKIKKPITNFGYAYFCLSGTFLVWGLAAFLKDQTFLNTSVIFGNFLLLLGSLFMLSVEFNQPNSLKWGIVTMGGVLSVLFLWWRQNNYPPRPMLEDGILVFNTELPVAIILGLVIVSIWLPTSLKVAKIIGDTLKIESLVSVYALIYIMATIASLAFIAARTMPIIILSFIGILLSFVMLVVSNLLITKLVK